MNVVAEETWSWMLLAEVGANGDVHYLSVVCGSSALYEIDFALNAGEIAQ
jgi:hypothetical protein